MRHHFLTVICLLCIALLMSACGKSPFCWGEDKNEGIIEQQIDLPCTLIQNNEAVIDSDSAYATIRASDPQCKAPEIDFQKHTLLGLYATGGCAMKLKRKVTIDEGERQYVYHVMARDCGICQKMVVAFNWVLVPKLPAGWTVRFELETK